MSDIETEEVILEPSGNDGEVASVAYDAHEFERRLIEEVQQRPFLFDHTNGGFKDLKKKDAAWIMVAETVGTSVNKCQCRWKSLRDRYVRESRKLREGNGPKRHMWEMFKYLTFLDDIPRLHRGGGSGGGSAYGEPTAWPVKTTRPIKRPALFVLPTTTAPPSQPQTVQVAVGSGCSSSSYVTTSSAASSTSTITVSSPSPTPVLTVALTENPTLQMVSRKPSSSSSINNSNISNNTSNNNNTVTAFNNGNILTTFVDMADGCSAFGMSVSATLRTLPLEQQELAKLRIQQVLYEVQFS